MDNTTRLIVREQKFTDVDIIPGSRLKLKGDFARTLLAGNYLVTGTLFVDGKRAKAIEKEVSYAGDKTATKNYADAVIQTDPSAVLIETSPGNMKSITVKVTNGSDDRVQIRAHMLTPKPLGGFVVFGKRGDDLSCAEWIEVTPSEFELPGFRSQNIKIVSKMPEGGMDYRGYYADLNLYASYADGTNAGMTSAQVCVVNRQVTSNPMVSARDVKIENTEPSKYIISARFVNEGDVHVSPKCEAQLVQTNGSPIKTGIMTCEGKSPVMLPLEQRDFSGDLDLTYIEPGYYRVEARLDYNPVASLDYTPVNPTRSLGETKTPASAKTPEIRFANIGKPIRIKLDENNYRVVEVISDSTYKQEASKARGAIKW
jgi:hypothetical protein